MTDIDLTRPGWGHNFSVIDWPTGDLWAWLTPTPVAGDVLLIQGRKGVIRAKIIKIETMTDPKDMHRLKVVPDE